MTDDVRRHVVILGGGFAAVYAYRTLLPATEAGEIDVTVVTRDNFLCAHGLIPEMVTGRIVPGTILHPLRRIFKRANLHVAEVVAIDLEARRVTTERHLDGARTEVSYDELVFALGSAENLDAYPGLAEHAFKLKKFSDSFALRNRVVEMFELADVETSPEERRRLLTFLVAGGGFAGTEMAGELADFARLLTKREYRGIRLDECRVVIVHPGPTLLPELHGSGSLERKGRSFPKLIEFAMRHARDLGVELMLDTRVVGATPNEVHLSDGSRVPTRTIVSAVGTKPAPVIASLELPFDERGRIRTDELLRVEGRENLWAAGDCAAVPHPGGGTCPPGALWARAHGRHLGRNVARAARGRSPKPFRRAVRMQGISLGRRTGVAEVLGIPLKGKLAWLGFRCVLFVVVPSWDRRVRALADWLIWPLVGRDIVQMSQGLPPDFDLHENVFQPGELIAERARPVRHVHVVIQGEVEVLRRVDGAEEVFETLGPGSHFGRKWLELAEGDAVRARTLVRTLALRADQVNALQDLLTAASPIIARTALHEIPRGALQ